MNRQGNHLSPIKIGIQPEELTLLEVLNGLKNKDIRKHLFVQHKLVKALFRYKIQVYVIIYATGQHFNRKCSMISVKFLSGTLKVIEKVGRLPFSL